MLRTQHILITGGSSGLGLALAKACVRQGHHVALLARDSDKLNEAVKMLRQLNTQAKVLSASVDVQDFDSLKQGVNQLAKELNGIDVLINSAGILREGYFEELAISTHQQVMAINYFGTLHSIHATLPHLKRSQHGRIINIASIAGLTGVFGYSAYCASKHALVGLSEVLRYELAPQEISVQLVCPPEFDSPMVDSLNLSRTPENREHTLTIPKVSVDVIVDEVMSALSSQEFLIIPSRLARLTALGLRHFPRLSRWVSDLRIQQKYVGPTHYHTGDK